MIIESVVPSLALKIIPVKNTKSFMTVLTVICGGSLNLEILRGGRAQAVLEIQVEVLGGGGSKNRAICRGEGVDFSWKNQFV